jgi:hypothetical protein
MFPGNFFDGAGEALRPMVVAVAGDHTVQPGDPMSSEEHPRPGEEADGGRRSLVLEGLGVGQPGVPVDRGMQLGVSDPSSGVALGLQRRPRPRGHGPTVPSTMTTGPCQGPWTSSSTQPPVIRWGLERTVLRRA